MTICPWALPLQLDPLTQVILSSGVTLTKLRLLIVSLNCLDTRGVTCTLPDIAPNLSSNHVCIYRILLTCRRFYRDTFYTIISLS